MFEKAYSKGTTTKTVRCAKTNKMKKLIKYDFSHYSVLELIALIYRVIKNILNNSDFPGIQSQIAPLQQSADDLKMADSDTLNGGPQQTQIVATKRAIANDLLVTMSDDVEAACAGDRVKALGSGFDVSQETSIKKVMPVKVTNVEAQANGGVGLVDVEYEAEVNRVMYRIEKATVIAGVVGTFTTGGYTTKIKYTVAGLTPGTTYMFRVFSINNLGQSDPSDNATAISL